MFDNVGGGEGIQKCTNTNADIYFCINQYNIETLQGKNCDTMENILFFAGEKSQRHHDHRSATIHYSLNPVNANQIQLVFFVIIIRTAKFPFGSTHPDRIVCSNNTDTDTDTDTTRTSDSFVVGSNSHQ
ncbi:hypothetical protein ESCO_001949 [Escovopsis weberi]|uniref:Uncharacterized protein n=1 Tax=Escovopsis weberi TaxID=150374 RepID=A0A0M9VWH9_ESCWE|nr:hypothetical protein ESCO_001949 [Escovopsis weberi]